MRIVSIIGILLIIVGTAGLIWGGFVFPRNREVVEVGSVEVETETTERVDIPAWLAGVTLAGGVVLVGIGVRKK